MSNLRGKFKENEMPTILEQIKTTWNVSKKSVRESLTNYLFENLHFEENKICIQKKLEMQSFLEACAFMELLDCQAENLSINISKSLVSLLKENSNLEVSKRLREKVITINHPKSIQEISFG